MCHCYRMWVVCLTASASVGLWRTIHVLWWTSAGQPVWGGWVRLEPRIVNPTRLETRTKESTKCASLLVTNQTRRNESESCDPSSQRAGGLQQGSVLIVCERDLKLSTFAGTRKIASFSWAEGSQGKPWWTFEGNADVQIACQTWVKGRKTHRAI